MARKFEYERHITVEPPKGGSGGSGDDGALYAIGALVLLGGGAVAGAFLYGGWGALGGLIIGFLVFGWICSTIDG